MSCPKCSANMAEVGLARRCTKCDGLWISKSALASQLANGSDYDVLLKVLAGSKRSTGFLCHTCGDKVLVASESDGLEIDWCEACHGVFLDRGELQRGSMPRMLPRGVSMRSMTGDIVGEAVFEVAFRLMAAAVEKAIDAVGDSI